MLHVQIELDGTMACGGDKIWPLFCRVGPMATRMYQLMIAFGFLKGHHPKYRLGSATAYDPGYFMVTQFEEAIDKVDEPPFGNPKATREEVFTEDKFIAGETPIMRAERWHVVQNCFGSERRCICIACAVAWRRAEEEEGSGFDAREDGEGSGSNGEEEEEEEELAEGRGGMTPHQHPFRGIVEIDNNAGFSRASDS